MPKISRVRIVNFNYNDGNRLIADELFDFTNQANSDALNVLVNLANGGGKSVLVQLMMQPIIPRAKVAGRKIESFFNRPTDHCFVLLEWLKDNSPEKLMTGIAIAARSNASTEEDSSEGMGIRYYTFYSNYTSCFSDYSLANLPLSSRSSNTFHAAEYDIVKKLSRKGQGALIYYSSEDSTQWKRKLEEYGLIQNEWHMMEKLNSEEGGLGKFFGGFKTSDQLIDGLLIPTIEGKLKIAHSKEDASLTTMLISYAGQYASQKNKLQKKESYEKFYRGLEILKPMTETAWNEYNDQQNAVSRLYGLSAALQRELYRLQEKQTALQGDIQAVEEGIHHIRWEQASEKYYLCQDAFRQADELWQQVNHRLTLAQEEFDRTRHDLAAQECASYYQQLHLCESNLQELQAIIAQREEHADPSGEIAVLGYSAACAIQDALSENRPKLEEAKAQKETLTDRFREKNCHIEETGRALSEAQSEFDRLDGRLDAARAETDRDVEHLGAEITRRLDLSYANEEFDALEHTIQEKSGSLTVTQEKVRSDIQDIESRLEVIPQEMADCQREISMDRLQKDSLEDELQQYEAQEKQILGICDEHTLNFSRRFTGEITSYLNSEKRIGEAKYGETLRRIALSEEEIQAATSGYLHVPHGVIEYLNSTGVSYTTCEKYLLELVQAQKKTKEECLTLLKNYPAAAYGILMDQKNKEAFFAHGREKWLPAMIPLFTYDTMDKILNNKKNFTGAIAFYSEEYFADREHYISHLVDKQRQLQNSRELEQGRNEHLEKQIKIMENFPYPEDWKEHQTQQIALLQTHMQEKENQYTALKQEKETISRKKQQLTVRQEDLSRQMQEIQNRYTLLTRIRERLETERALLEHVGTCRAKRDDLRQQSAKEQQELEGLKQQLTRIKNQADALEKMIQELGEAFTEVDGRYAEKRLPGPWKELLDRYRQRIQSEHAEMEQLYLKRKEQQDYISRYQRELQKRELPAADYENLQYSSELEMELVYRIKEQEHSLAAVQKEANDAGISRAKAETSLYHAEEENSSFGGILEKAQIGTDFNRRMKEYHVQQTHLQAQEKQCILLQKKDDKEQIRLENYLADLPAPDAVLEIPLEEDPGRQCTTAINEHKSAIVSVKTAEQNILAELELLRKGYPEDASEITGAIDSLTAMLKNKLRGDRFYTLHTLADEYSQNTRKAISQIATDLKEFENSRGDLIRQCVLQGKQIFDGLRKMESSSRVTVHDGKPRQNMLRFDFPDHVDAAVAEASIGDEIDKGSRELAEKLSDESVTKAEIEKQADKIVGSKSLLRKYLGREQIQVSAYKIDQNPENSGYRRWKDTQINNSGAEKFVVYFAVILSLINYTRGSLGGIQDKELHSVLILDNPFGATSSRHILVPMFGIAKHFRVQMICLSDINKADVINCFDIVIKALVKKRPASNRELLTHEGNESIEHGFYRSEQISLL